MYDCLSKGKYNLPHSGDVSQQAYIYFIEIERLTLIQNNLDTLTINRGSTWSNNSWIR